MTQVTSLSSSPSPIVSMYNGKPTTSSLNVAEVFSKRHDNVVRDIRVLSDNVPETFYALNFEESSYINEQGKEQPMLTLTRDGLTLLVMGYTGKKAMQFKLAYIEAFNQMEAQLEGQSVTDCHQLPGGTATPSTAADRAPLRALVNAWAQVTGVHHAALWPQLKAHFQLSRIDDLPVEWMPDALAFVQGKIDAHQTHAATASAALPEAPATAAIPPAPAQTPARKKHSPGPVERDIAAFIDEIESMYPLKHQFDDALRRLRNTVSPLYKATYDALGWHPRAGFPVDYLGEALGEAYWTSQRNMQDAFEHAHHFARVFRTLAKMHGM